MQNLADFLRGSNIVSELDARRAMTSERGPKPEHHPTGLEEANLVVGLLGTSPAKGLVEGASSTEVGYAKRYETDPLLHGTICSTDKDVLGADCERARVPHPITRRATVVRPVAHERRRHYVKPHQAPLAFNHLDLVSVGRPVTGRGVVGTCARLSS